MSSSLPNNHRIHSSGNSVFPQSQTPNRQRPLRGVGQDKRGASHARSDSAQPASLEKGLRAQETGRNTPRTQNRSDKLVQVTLWVKPSVKAELQRLAQGEEVSVSRVGAALLEEQLRHNIHQQYEGLIQTVIETAMQKQMNRLLNQQAEYDGRCLFEVGQLRWLMVNKLYRDTMYPEKKLTKEAYYKLLDDSVKGTMQHIRRWTPQIAEVIEAIKKHLKGEEEEQA